MENKNYYIYQHTRLDTNKVFYIGISKTKNYRRSKDKYTRSEFWKKVVNKTKYKIDILYENLTLDEANTLEVNLISFYGRKNLGLGELVNLTDGGLGLQNYIASEKTKLKLSLSNTKSKSKKVINISTNQIWDSAIECAFDNNLKYKYLQTRLSEEKINNTNFRYLDKKDCLLTKTNNSIKKVICIETGKSWNSITQCAFENNISNGFLANKLNPNNCAKNDTTFRIKGCENISKEYVKPKLTKLINIETNEIFDSIKQCAEMNNISYKTLGKRICGELKNNTPFKKYENDRTTN